MNEELKSKIDSLITYLTKKIEKKESFPEIQQQYDDLIEFLEKVDILTTEESEKIEKAMGNLESNLKKAKEDINMYIVQKNADDKMIKSLKDEIEKNSNLDEQYKKLNEEYNILKQNYTSNVEDVSDYQLKLKNNEKLINDLQNELNKVKQEIFVKKEKITNLEQELRKKESKINENNEQINKLMSEKTDLSNTNVELRNKNEEQQKSYESKIQILEKQLKHLSDANNNFVVENNEVQTQLKDFQMFTNMAKVNTKKLNKEDFSILEVMSNRAEKAEMEVQKLLSYIDELKALNEQIRNKIKPLEDYALLQIKHNHEINIASETIFDIQNKVFTEEEKRELFKLKNDNNELFQTLIKLKTENLELHNHIKDITIECNQQLREMRWKNK